MTLRTKFILFILLVHSIMLLLSFQLLPDYKWFFILVEVFIVFSVILSIRLYQQFIKPINLISSGLESMKDQDFNTQFVKTGQPEMDQLIDVYNNMISQLREERIIQKEQHYFLQRLITASPSGIIILDFDDKITSLNPAAELLLNLAGQNAKGKKLSDLEGELFRHLDSLEKGKAEIINLNGIKAYKCQKTHFVDRGFHHHFILVEELTEHLLKTEKKAYDKVIRMMSHEINNSIGAINSILKSSLNYKSQLNVNDSSDFENALNVAIERNEQLNRFMSNFADVVRTPPPVKETYDLHKLIKDVEIIMQAHCRVKNIVLKLELDAHPFMVKIDTAQMEQVVMNLLKNSIEAIKDEGQIIIKTQCTPVKRFSVVDNGEGLSKEIKSQLFTPFFSTKPTGQGIGLTLIKEILINHGFPFSLFENEQGRTEFRIDMSG